MKKLLSSISAITICVATITPVISCGQSDNDENKNKDISSASIESDGQTIDIKILKTFDEKKLEINNYSTGFRVSKEKDKIILLKPIYKNEKLELEYEKQKINVETSQCPAGDILSASIESDGKTIDIKLRTETLQINEFYLFINNQQNNFKYDNEKIILDFTIFKNRKLVIGYTNNNHSESLDVDTSQCPAGNISSASIEVDGKTIDIQLENSEIKLDDSLIEINKKTTGFTYDHRTNKITLSNEIYKNDELKLVYNSPGQSQILSIDTSQCPAGDILSASIESDGKTIDIQLENLSTILDDKLLKINDSQNFIYQKEKKKIIMNISIKKDNICVLKYGTSDHVQILSIDTSQCPAGDILSASIEVDGKTIDIQLENSEIKLDDSLIEINKKTTGFTYDHRTNKITLSNEIYKNDELKLVYNSPGQSQILSIDTSQCPAGDILSASIESDGQTIDLRTVIPDLRIKENFISINGEKNNFTFNDKNNQIKLKFVVYKNQYLKLEYNYNKEEIFEFNTSNCPTEKIDLSNYNFIDGNYKVNLAIINTPNDIKLSIIKEFIMLNKLDDDYRDLKIDDLSDENGISIDSSEEISKLTENNKIMFIIKSNNDSKYSNQTKIISLGITLENIDLKNLTKFFSEKTLDKNGLRTIKEVNNSVYKLVENIQLFSPVNEENTNLNLLNSSKNALKIDDLSLGATIYFELSSNGKNKSISGSSGEIKLVLTDSTSFSPLVDYHLDIALNTPLDAIESTIKNFNTKNSYIYKLIAANYYYKDDLLKNDAIKWDFTNSIFDTKSTSEGSTRITTFNVTVFNNKTYLVNVAYKVAVGQNNFFSNYVGSASYINKSNHSIRFDPFLIPSGKMINSSKNPIEIEKSDLNGFINIEKIQTELKSIIRENIFKNFPDIKIDENHFEISFVNSPGHWLYYTNSWLSSNQTRNIWLNNLTSDANSFDLQGNIVQRENNHFFSGNASFDLFVKTNKYIFSAENMYFLMKLN